MQTHTHEEEKATAEAQTHCCSTSPFKDSSVKYFKSPPSEASGEKEKKFLTEIRGSELQPLMV